MPVLIDKCNWNAATPIILHVAQSNPFCSNGGIKKLVGKIYIFFCFTVFHEKYFVILV